MWNYVSMPETCLKIVPASRLLKTHHTDPQVLEHQVHGQGLAVQHGTSLVRVCLCEPCSVDECARSTFGLGNPLTFYELKRKRNRAQSKDINKGQVLRQSKKSVVLLFD